MTRTRQFIPARHSIVTTASFSGATLVAAGSVTFAEADARWEASSPDGVVSDTRSIAWVGDIDADGPADAAFGEPRRLTGDVATGGVRFVLSASDTATGNLPLTALTTALWSTATAVTDMEGRTVAGVADADGDGHDNVVVAGNLGFGLIKGGNGRACLFEGSVLAGSGNFDDTYAAFCINGDEREDLFANTLAAGSDVTGDGVPDVVAGAVREGAEYTSGSTSGEIYLFQGWNP